MVPTSVILYQLFNLGIKFKILRYGYLTLIIIFNITYSFTHRYFFSNTLMLH